MNTRTLACLLAMGTLMPAVGFAQGGSSVGVFGSYWDTDEADEAWGVGAKWRWEMFELRGTFYEDVTSDSNRVEVEDIPIEAGFVINFAPDLGVNPYLGAGVSYHLLDTNFGDIDDEAGWYALVGGEFGMAEGISLLGEVMYRDIEGTVTDLDGGTLIRDEADIDLGGFAANVGVAWRF